MSTEESRPIVMPNQFGRGLLHCANASTILVFLQMCGAAGVLAIWFFSYQRGRIAAFDLYGMPVVAGMLAVMALAAWRRPEQFLATARLPLLGLLFAYVQLSLAVALFAHGGTVDANAVVRLGLGTPLLYLASFALLVRRAYLLPSIQGVLISMQCALALWLQWKAQPTDVVQTLFAMVVLQPLYFALLYWINYQRRQTIAAGQAAAASRMTMLAMVSHELKSPLQLTRSSLNGLERRMTALNLPKGELLHVHRIRSALAQLDSHLNDMLVITRQGGDLAPARAEPFRLDATLKALVGSYVGAAQDRGCLIRLEIGEGCGYVEGDSLRFHQVVNNLLNNAVKYTQEGEIHLKVTRLNDERVAITIQDTGIGIEASKIDAIWEPHVRNAADPYVRLTEGSGLGLAVVRLLVGMMGGEVSMSSEPNKGTTVSLILPLPALPDTL